MQRLSFKTILSHLPLQTYIGVILLTTLTYGLIDFVPIYEIIPVFEARIVQALWQSGVWSIYAIILSFMICYGLSLGFGHTQKNFFQFFTTFFSEFLATKLRVMVHTTLWALLFIIPGFIMALKYSLSEMVIFFSPNFLEDRTQDPLKISSEKIGFYIPTLLILLALYFILPMAIDESFSRANFNYNPIQRVIQIILYSLLNLFTYIYLFKIFYTVEQKNTTT